MVHNDCYCTILFDEMVESKHLLEIEGHQMKLTNVPSLIP